MSFRKVDPKQSFPEMEEKIVEFWEKNKTFEKSLEIRQEAPRYSFYDGPPFATGLPHYGHIVASTIKDTVPRYWTMRGFQVERKWGWDCHGLPIENIAEKELGITRKKEIEEMGVEKFNGICRSKVLEYVGEWEKIMKRFGRWADMRGSYKTMNPDFMESVWWTFKELWDRGLIYQGYRSMHICPRCETTLSQSEVAEGYKDVKDLSATVKFELEEEPGTFILAWTTTPWTLIANVALAVGEELGYVLLRVKDSEEKYIVAKKRLGEILQKKEYEILREFQGKEMIGKKYKPLFDYYAQDKNLENRKNGWKIYSAPFVTTQEGTGVVHIAPAFGEEDLNLGREKQLPFVQHLGMDGIIRKEGKIFSGMNVKPKEDYQKTDQEILKFLEKKKLLFSWEEYTHSYPHCWRCETPLINYATSSWFVGVEKNKERMLELAKEINWQPKHVKEGRFGNWLEGARDWSISRQRYWASVMPIWECEKCKVLKVFGSLKELEAASGQKISDLHKHVVDKITFQCEKCDGKMKRIPDVLDTWFDSGSMPYAQAHYPFENKEKFEKSFPAEFIAEGIDQTRCWFYYLHVIASAIKKSVAFKNVIVNGIVLAEDGKKMSKRLNNYPDPEVIFQKYGADALRFYLLSSPVMAAENLNFKEGEVAEILRGPFRRLWNSYSFFVLYANIDKWTPEEKDRKTSRNLLDKWIISELNLLMAEVNREMENYDLNRAVRLFPRFIDQLSNWYIRRSRKRFWKSEDDQDKDSAYWTLWKVLTELAKLLAPFTPFLAEEIYKNLTGKESVHFEDFPRAEKNLINEELNEKMEKVRDIVREGLQLRSQAGIRVRQPLSVLRLKLDKLGGELQEIIKEELNVKAVKLGEKIKEDLELETEITQELKLEGQAREIIRFIQEMRKQAGYQVDDRIQVSYQGLTAVFKKFGSVIAKETLINKLSAGVLSAADLRKDLKIGKENLEIFLKR